MYNHNNFADQGAIGDAIAYDPTKSVYSGTSDWRGYTTWTMNGNSIDLAPGNPVARLDLTDNTSVVKRSIGNVKFDYELPFIKNLHANLNLGYDYSQTTGHNNVADQTQWAYLPTTAGGRYNPYEATAKNQLLDFYLNYNKNLEPIKSKLEVVGGYSWSHFYSAGQDSTMNVSKEIPASRVNIYETEYYLVSFFGRLNYTFNNKYLLTATLRNDNTSRFDESLRSGLFPSVALAWKIKEENFIKDVNAISDLKLRVGYGATGQQDVGQDYAHIATYTISDKASRYQLGNTFYNTLRPDGYNQFLKWESTATYNAGLDYGLFGNRITGTLDFYHRKSTNLLSYLPPSAGSNFTGHWQVTLAILPTKVLS